MYSRVFAVVAVFVSLFGVFWGGGGVGILGHTDHKYRIILLFCSYLWNKVLRPRATGYTPALDESAYPVCVPKC